MLTLSLFSLAPEPPRLAAVAAASSINFKRQFCRSCSRRTDACSPRRQNMVSNKRAADFGPAGSLASVPPPSALALQAKDVRTPSCFVFLAPCFFHLVLERVQILDWEEFGLLPEHGYN